MATCVVKPSLLNKFTFSPVYVPPVGDEHRLVCFDAVNNLMFSPEHSFHFIKNWLTVPLEMLVALFLLWAPPIIRTGRHKRQRYGW